MLLTPHGEGHGASVEAGPGGLCRRAAAGFRAAQAKGGADAVGVFGGGGLTNEKAYLLGKLARTVLRTSQIDYNGRFCMSSAAAGALRAFGLDRGLPFLFADLAEADCVLLAGSNLAETMPPVMQHLTRQRQAGGTLVVVDLRRTPTAAAATLHLQCTPGTDVALANGLLYLAIEQGHVDQAYVDARTTGWEQVRAAVAGYWPARVERLTGVSEPDLREAVRLLGAASTALVLTARGAELHAHGVDTVSAWIDLALALGLPGTPGSGWECLTGQGNGQGGREHGQKAEQLPGYRRLDDSAARAHVAAVWGVDPDDLPQPGRSAYELLDALGTDGGPSALLLMGSSPVVGAPRDGHVQQRSTRSSSRTSCFPRPPRWPTWCWPSRSGRRRTARHQPRDDRRRVRPPAHAGAGRRGRRAGAEAAGRGPRRAHAAVRGDAVDRRPRRRAPHDLRRGRPARRRPRRLLRGHPPPRRASRTAPTRSSRASPAGRSSPGT